MKKTMISVCALLLVGATGMMTAGAQVAPKLAVFVVGMNNTLGDKLATQIGSELNRNSRYTVATGEQAVQAKLAALRTQGAGSIDRNALAEWGRTNGIATICLVTDAVNGSDHMFYAHLIDAKDSKVNGRGSHIRTGIAEGDLPRVSLALSRQLDGPGRRRSAPAPTRSYPAELDIEMVFVEGGTFTMGCVPARDGTCQSSELPAHEVTLSSFYIGKYAITQAQWKAVMGSNPSKFTTDDQLPVESASWEDIANAGGFLEKLNTLTGKKYRLPTEEEWEYAARGGKHKSPYMYSGSNVIDEVGWYSGNSGNSTRPVAQKKPNELGIYDMTGNLWEWVADLARASYSSTTTSSSHVVRGGVWADPNTGTHRIAHRNTSSGTPNRRDRYFGFRVVLPAQ